MKQFEPDYRENCTKSSFKDRFGTEFKGDGLYVTDERVTLAYVGGSIGDEALIRVKIYSCHFEETFFSEYLPIKADSRVPGYIEPGIPGVDIP